MEHVYIRHKQYAQVHSTTNKTTNQASTISTATATAVHCDIETGALTKDSDEDTKAEDVVKPFGA
jgi:hypothetical protein